MTSCGLNGGPLPAGSETPAYVCCHLRSTEGALHATNGNPLGSAHPRVTQEADAGCATSAYAYVAGLRDGSEVGYKHLRFVGENRLRLEVRGSFTGILTARLNTADGETIAEASISATASEGWHDVEAPLAHAVEGTHAVYFDAHGYGALDLRAFTFVRE